MSRFLVLVFGVGNKSDHESTATFFCAVLQVGVLKFLLMKSMVWTINLCQIESPSGSPTGTKANKLLWFFLMVVSSHLNIFY